MKTPDGRECKHYYEDFNRGRNVQECRLISAHTEGEKWHPTDCSKCPVPDILLANADPDMELSLVIKKGFLGFGRKLEVTAHSRSDGSVIADPYVGKEDKNNANLNLFRQALEEMNDDD